MTGRPVGPALRMDSASSELLSRFTDPAPAYGPLPLWWWSGAKVTRERLRAQMAEMVSQGIRQAVVMCLAPTGPMFGALADDPPYLSAPWLSLLDQACADAAELGFSLWMYDQIGFSGANFQGQLISAKPDFAGLTLHRTTVTVTGATASAGMRPPAGHTALSAYVHGPGGRTAVPLTDGAVHWSGGPAEITLVHCGAGGFDYFGEAACAALLDRVHGTLERHAGRWFGSVIGGFFQDELPAMPTWGRDFAATFTETYGYDPVPELWALWEDETDGAGADAGTAAQAARVRRDYHEHRARLGRRAFFGPQQAFFDRHGLICGFDQPSPAREGDPVGGVRVYGDYHATHAGYGAPGSDHWGDAKVHSSMAHAHGHGRTWIEAFHSSGWGGTLEETYDWLAPFLRRGANLYDPHAIYYSTPGGWWEWAPPSTCWRQPYWPAYHVFSTAVARLCSVLTLGSHVCDTILLSPTTTAQSCLTLEGPLAPARAASAVYHELNGVNTWFDERRGVLERAGLDHDVFDETTLARAGIMTDATGAAVLEIGGERYRTVVLPEPWALHTAAARTLVRFAEAGGRVVCAGSAPRVFLGAAADEDAAAGKLFAEAVDRRLITVVDSAADVPAAVAGGPVRITSDAPYLLRRHGDAYVLTLIAHDEISGTRAPVVTLDADDRLTGGSFPWQEYWRQLRTEGYDFRPSVERRAKVSVQGLPEQPRVQRWDPGTGNRAELAVTQGPDGSWLLDVPFTDGPVALLVIAGELPLPTHELLGPVTNSIHVKGPWRALAVSTLDNSRGDLAAADRPGILPVEVWRMEHREDENPEWGQATAGFGPFAHVREGAGDWRPAHWSLSRGIRDDIAHDERLGPKGYVPEEFLDWRKVPADGLVAVRTHLTLPGPEDVSADSGLFLAVGANAARRVLLDGTELTAPGEGYQTFSPLPPEAYGRDVVVEIELRALEDGPVRASFAVVSDPGAFRRPEWMTAGDGSVPGRTHDLTLRAHLDEIPAEPVVQVSSDGACAVLVNGQEVGRQGDFSPYPDDREVRVHPYSIGERLRTGENTLTLRVTDAGTAPTAAALDSTPAARGGLGWLSGAHWQASCEGAPVPLRPRPSHGGRDPRFICAWARPHPLPGAHWLEPASAAAGVVRPLVPDTAPGPERVEWLRFTAPLGTTALRIPTPLTCSVLLEEAGEAGGQEYGTDAEGWVRFPGPLAAGATVLVRIVAVDGRRGGALLDAAVRAEVEETDVTLTEWAELGLRALGGYVRYRTTAFLPDGPTGRTLLDLGDVRGTAEVTVNGRPVGQRVWGPWTFEVTDTLRKGANDIEVVVRGTLAGYLEEASPTRAIAAGQVRTGLFGPVRITGR
ncbi:hypothetical protein [Streptomyces sp. NPDC088725]|uniref:hypothetical protein n=1 Tax=Streptomyces sp. NPDC088725 TaxID=3365873 RepID=UPI003825C927